jgi:hypothetical protein
MQIKLDTSTFRFDADRDYLPDFKHNTIMIEDTLSVKDLLLEVEKKEHLFAFDKENTMVQINTTSVLGSLDIAKAVALFGTDWTIEPISTFRAKSDLIIDDADFYAKHAVLEAFGDEEDFAYYKTLIREYYASGTLSYNQDYMGDSMFLYADYLIKKYPAKKEAILDAIDVRNGIGSYEKECNLYPYNDNMETIHALEAQLFAHEIKGFSKESMAYYDKAESVLCSHFSATKDEDCALETILDNITLEKVVAEVKHPFSDFKVAFYAGDFACQDVPEVKAEAKKLLSAIGAEVVDFALFARGDGFDIVADDESVAYKKAGSIVFDAIDSGAEIIVVDSKESHFMMDQCKRACEKAIGRDIRVPVLNISQMVALAIGITNKEKLGLDAHKIVVEFV